MLQAYLVAWMLNLGGVGASNYKVHWIVQQVVEMRQYKELWRGGVFITNKSKFQVYHRVKGEEQVDGGRSNATL